MAKPATFEQIAAVFGLSKQAGQLTYERSMLSFRTAWEEQTGELISRGDAEMALATLSCSCRSVDLPEDLAGYVQAYREAFEEETGRAIGLQTAVEHLCSVAECTQ